MITDITHKLLDSVKSRTSHVFRISFKDSDIFLLEELSPIDPSIYGSNGQWTAKVVEVVCAPPKKEKLFEPGMGLDFREEDVREIFDTTIDGLVYKA